MRLYTSDECEQWLTDRKRVKPDEIEGSLFQRILYPRSPHRLFYIAHWTATQLTYRMPVLLWLTEWGIWGSSEYWHLYYRLRQPHGDLRLLHEAPGHLFLGHEAEDLTSFLQVSMLNGWGGYVLTQAGYANLFFSHDEYVDFYSDNQSIIDEIQKELSDNKAASGISRD